MKELKPNSRRAGSAPADWQDVNRRLQRTRAAVEEALTPSPGEKRKILRGRARELAQEAYEESVAGESAEVVELLIAGERYTVESAYVREVYSLKEITNLPGTPPFVLGITNVRGRVIAVNDLRRFFGLAETQVMENSKLVILRHGEMECGVLADEVRGVRTLTFAQLQPPQDLLTDARSEYLRGITLDRLALLDAEKILSDKRMMVDEEV